MASGMRAGVVLLVLRCKCQWPCTDLLSYTIILLHLLSRAAVCAIAPYPKQPVGSPSSLSTLSCISDHKVLDAAAPFA
jgi:hypothetical protein